MITLVGGFADAAHQLVEENNGTAARAAPPPRTTAAATSRAYYPRMPTRRAVNAVVQLEVGQGRDLDALKAALKRLKRAVEHAGVARAVGRHAEFVPRNERRRAKSARARAKMRRLARMRECLDARDWR